MEEEFHLVVLCLWVLIFSGALSQIVVERNEKACKHVAKKGSKNQGYPVFSNRTTGMKVNDTFRLLTLNSLPLDNS